MELSLAANRLFVACLTHENKRGPYGRDLVEGELVLIDADEIALRRRDPRLGDIVVHFPRLGYDLRQM